ncbi:MAG: lipoyl synthase [Acidimicrobiia bacterium]|nr:lipoyl synthase [Acidimicrobiia bacterium]
MSQPSLQVRWLGRVAYVDADALQRGLHSRALDDYLLLLEHPHVYTLGTRARPEHVLVPPASVGADLVRVDRGGDVTYHGPGQLVGYPIITLPDWRDGQSDVVAYVRALEDVLIAVLADFGVAGERHDRLTGVWVGDEKVAAIGVKVARGRTRHGFALNVDPELSMFEHIVPCGIPDKGVTSLARLAGDAPPMTQVLDAVVARFAERFGPYEIDRQDVSTPTPSASRHAGRQLLAPSVPRSPVGERRRPEWMRVKANLGEEYRATRRLMRSLDLNTVCEEAGCPNIYECWADRTATFMILGERCTRACGFCLVDTRKPQPPDEGEPVRVADAVATLGLEHAVVTSVARDDLSDGGASGFVATIAAIRRRAPGTRVEVLVPDCKGDPASLDALFAARPDVLNHNLETVARLQRAARPSAGYARSLALLARAKDAGLVTQSGLIVGMGETDDEVRAAITDLRNVGVDILTVGQYLQPSATHLPVVRWWTPDELAAIGELAESLGFSHVEAAPLVRSSYHAKRAVEAASDAAPTRTAVGA